MESLKKHTLFCFCIFSFLINLSAQELYNVNIQSEIDKGGSTLKMSDFIESIQYIPLETNSTCLIDKEPNATVTDNEIIIRTRNNCFLFNRKTGKFIRTIGTKGRGPGEYSNMYGFCNSNTKSVYMMGQGNKLLEFNFNGEFQKSITLPGYVGDFDNPSIPVNFTWMNDCIVYYFEDFMGNQKIELMISNKNGEIVKKFPKYSFYHPKKGTVCVNSKESNFYHYNNLVYFKEDNCDTVFQVTEQKLLPKYVLYLGKYQPTYESKWLSSKKYNLLGPQNLIETDSYLIFSIELNKQTFIGLYNKRFSAFQLANIKNGLKNNIDNFIPFEPVSISTDGYLINLVEAYKIKDWFTNNPNKIKNLPIEIQNLKNIRETDNPILILAKLKK